ncbi:hypothetical protein HMPREF1092_03147 [Clostridium thermobutyricum]|uniref:Uncharacterized protein n=1 Tax=Clostridium thermobutyricum TaxID=29372 RepID=N9WAG2_9CLOT|nr:hypothetical protein [Clostridium thermobutyricum]ENZ00011.1 hypothetical protein HMPREF1092_03147 [Clostridium thermobutyricum]
MDFNDLSRQWDNSRRIERTKIISNEIRKNLGEVKIRKVTESDIKDILDIYNYAILKTTVSYDCKPCTLERRSKLYNEKYSFYKRC